MSGGPGWQQLNLFLCLPQCEAYILFSLLLCSFLFLCYFLFSVNSSVAATNQNYFFVRFWHQSIFVPLFYTKTSCPIFCVLWIEEESVVRFSNTSSDFEGPFKELLSDSIIRLFFCRGIVYVIGLITKGDLIFLVSSVRYIPPSSQTSSETSQPFSIMLLNTRMNTVTFH
ncbi:hypothetical protein M9H77_23165 [Catharanthus roseus]|uniref:Uncharacterized protein n=1 Tax=Catharanthus roseus TaxID=4058 RepID=A0ACC0AV28_CATRO|nr:hypothetical protein M9H77_23165 [Catharanthus roseus]